MHRGIDDYLDLGERCGERAAHGHLLGRQGLLFLPCPGIQAHQVRRCQQPCRPACCAPLGAIQEGAGCGARLAHGPQAAGAGQLELRQIPVTARCIQSTLGGCVQRDRAAQSALCGLGHRRVGTHRRGGGIVVGLRRQAGQGQHGGRERQHGDAVVCPLAAQNHLRVVRGADGKDFSAATGGGARGKFRHHARYGAACCLQRLQVVAQPAAVAHGHPHRAASAGARLQGKVQLGGVVQQAVFQQAFQNGAQAGCLLVGPQRNAGRQLHALP